MLNLPSTACRIRKQCSQCTHSELFCCDTANYHLALNAVLLKNRTCSREVEAVYLQTAFTPIASKKIHRNFASKVRPVRS